MPRRNATPVSLNVLKDDDTLRERMTEQGMNEDDIRRRDEEAKIFRIYCTNATGRQRLENTCGLDARDIRKKVNMLIFENAMQELRHVRDADLSVTQPKQPPQQHTHTFTVAVVEFVHLELPIMEW